MKFKKLLPLAALVLFAASCDKSDSLSDNNLAAEGTGAQQGHGPPQNGQVTTRGSLASYSQNPSIAPFREMFGNHFKYHATVEPWGYLPEPMRGAFKSRYEQERVLLDGLGHDAWIDQKVLNGNISNAFGTSMKNLDGTINGLTSGNLGSLVSTLEGQRNSLSLMTEEQYLAQLIYDIILNTINELYPEGGLEFRADPCKLSDLIDDIKTGAEIGAVVGEIVSAIFNNDGSEETTGEVIINVAGQAVSISLTVVGAVLGGIIGGIVGIFNGDDCDCGPPLGISVVNPTGTCSSTSGFQLLAWGAGDDAEFYDWTINEGNSSASFPGQPALLGPFITQASPSVPLNVVVTALCPEAMGDPIEMAKNTYTAPPINLFSLPSTQVGQITLYTPYAIQSGAIFPKVNEDGNFQLSTTFGGANISYYINVYPIGIANVTQNGGNFTVDWLNTGGGYISFSAINNCSGLANGIGFNFTVGP